MTEDTKRPLKVFLCHAHSDRIAVRGLYARLKREGVDVWLDKEKLLPGADWEYEIRKAVREADVVVVCLSTQFNQAGFRQKEVRIALDTAMEKPEGEIFIIPARLEECDYLESLQRFHGVDLFEEDGFQRLIRALRVRAEKIGAALRQRGTTISRPKPEEQEKQRLAKEQADREAVEKARLHIEDLQKQRLAKEQADREAIEKAAKINTERETAKKAAREEEKRLLAEKEKREVAGSNPVPRPKAQKTQNNSSIIYWIVGIFVVLMIWVSSLNGTPTNSAPTQILTKTFTPPQSTLTLTLVSPTKTKTPTLAPTLTSLSTEITDNGVPMRLVPAGEFEMGSTYGTRDETPVHPVYLADFYMDKYEVTNALYKICVDAGGCTSPQQTKSYTRSSYYGNSEFDNFPVIYVDWNQAKTYCEWRGPSTSSGQAHLPTEAQWEKAARGTDGRTYPWGEDIDCNKANYNGSCVGDTSKVGSYASGKSPYGIYDLAGNVWEWTADWHSDTYYQTSPSENPLGPDSGPYRVLRGGSWDYLDDVNARSANRNRYGPSYTNNKLGFRCARSLP